MGPGFNEGKAQKKRKGREKAKKKKGSTWKKEKREEKRLRGKRDL